MEFNITLTFSKVMAFLTLTLSFTYAFIMEDASLPGLAIPVVSIALGWKQRKDKEKATKNTASDESEQ